MIWRILDVTWIHSQFVGLIWPLGWCWVHVLLKFLYQLLTIWTFNFPYLYVSEKGGMLAQPANIFRCGLTSPDFLASQYFFDEQCSSQKQKISHLSLYVKVYDRQYMFIL